MKRLLTAAALCLCLSAPAFAQIPASVPSSINFQGRLAKPDGTPVPDANAQTVTFRLFSAASGGTALWSQTGSVAVRNGAFGAALNFAQGYAPGQGLSTIFSNPLVTPYLEIQVGNDAPLTPRQPLRTVPYAFTAGTALTAANGSIGLAQLAGGVLNFTNIAGSVTGSQIADGTITNNNLSVSLQQQLTSFGFVSAGVPVLRGSASTGNFPYGVAVSGGYAYVVNQTSGTLQIFDVTNPVNLALRGSATTANAPLSVAVGGAYAYVGGRAGVLQVFDISNPAAPALRGSINAGGQLGAVVISGGYAYATNFKSLQIFDISNPANPTLASSLSTTNSLISLAVSGSYAYVTSGGNALLVYDVSNPANPLLRGSAVTGTSPSSVALSGSYACVTSYNTNTLQVFDVSNPYSPTLTGSIATGAFPTSVTTLNNAAYVLSNAGLQTFDLSNPAAPLLNGGVSLPGSNQSVAASGAYAYVVGGANKLMAFSTGALKINASLQVAVGVIFGDGSIQTTALNGTPAGGALAGTYPNPYLANGSAGTAALATGAVTNDKIAAGAVTADKIAAGVLPTTLPPSGAAGGDLAGTFPNPVIAANAVTNDKLASDSASLSKVSGGVLSVPAASTLTVAANTTLVGAGSSAIPLTVIGTNPYPQFRVAGAFGSAYGALMSLDATATSGGKDWAIYSSSAGAGEGPGRFVIQNHTDGIAPLVILSTGQVGIRTANPNITYALDVNGVVHATSFSTASDARFKMNIHTLDHALEDIIQLRGVSYDMDRAKWAGKRDFPEGRQIGFIAQEVEKIFPELVLTDSEGYKSVLYQNAVPALVEAMKTLNAKVDKLQSENAELKKQNAAIAELAAKIERLEKALKP